MSASKVFMHQDYELLCGAKVLANGRYVPTLSISKRAWPTRPRDIAFPRGDYPSEDEAIAAAHAQGLAWINDYG